MNRTSTLLIAGALALTACGHPIQETSSSSSSSSGGSSGTTGNTHVQLSGSVEKGPFVLGSQITVSAVDASGNPTGQTFKTQTTDDLGQFSLTVSYAGPVNVEAQGYFFNELSGAVSPSLLTLEGFGSLPSSGSFELDVNVLTHLMSGRVNALTAGGSSMALATTQAQGELVAALGLGGAGFTLSQAANATHLTGSNPAADAYLLSVSLVFLQWAATSAPVGTEVTAHLQEVLNNARGALASTGTLPAETVGALHAAEKQLDPERIRQTLKARYQSVVGFVMPDLDAVLDSDLDGFVNDVDVCPLVATGDGGTAPGICSYRRQVTTGQIAGGYTVLLTGDFDQDGLTDVVQGNLSGSDGRFWRGLGAGAMSEPAPVTTQDFFGTAVADVNGDGKLDLVGVGNYSLSVVGTSAAWLPGEGDGGFGAVQTIIGTLVNVATPDADGGHAEYSCESSRMVDLNGDGRLDAVTSCKENALYPVDDNTVLIALQASNGSFGAPSRLALPSLVQLYGLGVADFDGDGTIDILVGSCSGFTCGGSSSSEWHPTSGLWLAHGVGDGTFTIESLTTSVGPNYPNLAVGDVDGDGKPDLAVIRELDSGDYELNVLLNDGAGHFAPSTALRLQDGIYYGLKPHLADLTGDGRADLVLVEGDSLVIYPSLGTTWAPSQKINVVHDATGDIYDFAFGDRSHGPDFVTVSYGRDAQGAEEPQLTTLSFNPLGWHSW